MVDLGAPAESGRFMRTGCFTSAKLVGIGCSKSACANVKAL